MTEPVGSTIQRQRLGSELRRLREAAELSTYEVARRLECSESKVSRIETGRVGATPRDVRAMLELYRASEDLRGVLPQLARETRQRGWWWHAYGDVPFVPAYVDFEVSAAFVRTYHSSIVPGILQTEKYARAVIRAGRPTLTPSQVTHRLQLRMRRQSVLAEERPQLSVVLDEAVLRRRVGGVKTMREQLHRLTEKAQQGEITLQVLTFEVGEHAAIDGEFTIFGFPDKDIPETVYLPHPEGGLYLRKESETRRYVQAFERLRNTALSPLKSAAFVADLAEEL